MRLARFLVRWRERQERIEREASTLITFLGDDMAYDEARGRARAYRGKGNREGDRLWSEVAVVIAKRTGREIGAKAADRYEREATREGRALARCRQEVGLSTRAVLEGLGEVARGRNVETELHNISAHVRYAEPRNAPDPAVAVAVVRAATDLAAVADRSSGLIEQGVYPPELEEAGHAVELWRTALLRAARR